MSFFSELRRRNVFRVGAAYAVVAWLLMQIVTLIEDPLSLPEQFDTLTIVALAIGFPIALILAWALELTPQGIRTTDEAPPADGFAPPRGQKLNYLIIVGLALVLVMVVIDSYVLREEPLEQAVGSEQAMRSASEAPAIASGVSGSTGQESSIAVLPLVNISSEPEQEDFADGLTEELIKTLSAIDGMRVINSTSSFFFKGSEQDPVEIAERLGVNYLLQGSVRKSGDQLRIQLSLSDAAEGFNLWIETFDRPLDDIFAIQREIAEAVSTPLSVTLAAGDFDRPGLTTDPRAYDEYLQAGAVVDSSAQDRMLNRIEHLERAVELDPDFALAWFDLGIAYRNAIRFSLAESAELYGPRAQQAFENARTLAPEMPELQRVELVGLAQSGGWSRLEQRLLDLSRESGSSVELALTHSMFHFSVGHRAEALQFARRAQRLGPLDVGVIEVLTYMLMELEHYEEAREHLNRGLQIIDYEPGTPMFAVLAQLEMLEGNWDAAIAASRNLITSRDSQVRILEYIAANDFDSGIREVRRLFEDPSTSEIVRERHLNVMAALMNEPELALEITMNAPNPANSAQLMRLPFGDEVRKLPGYKRLMEQFGLVDYWRESGDWGDFCRPLPDGEDFECF